MNTMKIGVLCIAVAACVSCGTARANTTYNFVDYPLLENGWTMSGQITTDGYTGTISSSDSNVNHLLSIWWEATNPNSPYSPITGFGSVTDDFSGTMQVNPSNITLDNMLIIVQGHDISGATWDLDSVVIPMEGGTYECSEVQNPSKEAWYYYSGGDPGTGLDGNGNWVIATAAPVPEPGTLTLLATAVLGLGGYLFARRRRAKG